MKSWKIHMPDYQFIHWDMEKIKDIKVPFLKEALEEKKWAFAADFVRLYAIYNYGGIYLDTDCLLYNSLDLHKFIVIISGIYSYPISNDVPNVGD